MTETRIASSDLEPGLSAGEAASKELTKEPDTGHLEERIRQAAYARYVQRGEEPGHALEDWLAAEAELTASAGQEPSDRNSS